MRPAGRLALALLLALTTLPAIAAAVPPAAPADHAPPGPRWRRIERLIEADYFRQDSAALEALAATLGSAGRAGADAGVGRDPQWRGYYAALAAYRLALLSKDDEDRAWPFTQRCIDRLNGTLVLDPASAEAIALQSACLARQSHLDPWRSPFAAPLSLARIDKALKLAPDNPRVLLLGALAARERPRLFGGDNQQSVALLERAVAAFERQSPVPQGLPGWGAADAFTEMAKDYLVRGDTLAARNVLERALLVAPEFAQARRLMARIVSG